MYLLAFEVNKLELKNVVTCDYFLRKVNKTEIMIVIDKVSYGFTSMQMICFEKME
jgi:hypothetical protein